MKYGILALGAGHCGWTDKHLIERVQERIPLFRELLFWDQLCFWSGKSLLWGSQEKVPFPRAFHSLGILSRKKLWTEWQMPKETLKSFWFQSPTLNSFAFQHLKYMVPITSHTSLQLYLCPHSTSNQIQWII